jgi:hypothetical protein
VQTIQYLNMSRSDLLELAGARLQLTKLAVKDNYEQLQ